MSCVGRRHGLDLGSGVAVALAQASSYSSCQTPSLGISICHGTGPKKGKKTKNKQTKKETGNISPNNQLRFLFKYLILHECVIPYTSPVIMLGASVAQTFQYKSASTLSYVILGKFPELFWLQYPLYRIMVESILQIFYEIKWN